MKIIKWLLLAILLTGFTYGQNLIYESKTWTSAAISDTIDMGSDTNKLLSDYGGTQEEVRIIGIWFDGTWTNTTLTVYACTTLGGTYDPVTNSDGTALTITMATNTWVYLEPRFFAGMDFIRLVGSAEGGARTYVVIKRRY
jgi:hypothetical protein